MTTHLLKQPLCCQTAELRPELNYSKEFKPFTATFLLHQIMRQDRLQACGRVQSANALHPGISQSPEVNIGVFFEEIRKKSELLIYSYTLVSGYIAFIRLILDRILLIDVVSRQIIGEYPTGDSPEGIAYSSWR